MGKGFLESYWEWLWGDDESFIDLNSGIMYQAHGKTRSMKGLFRNFDLPEHKSVENKEALKILAFLVNKGKVRKEDLLEYKEGKE
jgi:hypothetical protein